MAVTEKEFNALLVQYQPYIVSLVRRQGGGEELEDNVQEVIAQACKARKGFDPERGAFPTWLWWQVRSCMQNRRAYKAKRRDLNHSVEFFEDGQMLNEPSVPGNQLDHVELKEMLDFIAMQLSPRQANVVLHRAVGSTLEEIAEAYGSSKQYIDELRRTGLAKLTKRLNRIPNAMMGAL